MHVNVRKPTYFLTHLPPYSTVFNIVQMIINLHSHVLTMSQNLLVLILVLVKLAAPWITRVICHVMDPFLWYWSDLRWQDFVSVVAMLWGSVHPPSVFSFPPCVINLPISSINYILSFSVSHGCQPCVCIIISFALLLAYCTILYDLSYNCVVGSLILSYGAHTTIN